MKGVMPMPPPTQIWRGGVSSKVKQPYGPSTVTGMPGLRRSCKVDVWSPSALVMNCTMGFFGSHAEDRV